MWRCSFQQNNLCHKGPPFFNRGGEKCGLASITSAEENAFVYGLASSNPIYWTQIGEGNFGPWLGGYQYDHNAEPAGDWAWLSGEPWGYTNWAPNEPNNGGGLEDYLGLFHLEPGGTSLHMGDTWNDYLNEPLLDNGSPYPMVSYVVEIVPEPSTLILLGIGAISLLAYAWRRRRGRARCLSCAAVVVAMFIAGSAQADVFNMGGTRRPNDGNLDRPRKPGDGSRR